MATRLLALLTVTVAILCSVDGVKFSFNTAVSGEGTLNIYGLSLADCVQQCDGLQDCTSVNYARRAPLCQLITGNTSVAPKNRKGHVAVDVASGLFKYTYVAKCKKDCVADKIRVCPEEKEAEGTTVLGNMNFEGAKRVILCNDVYTLDGLNVTTCTANGTWSEHGKCVKFSTMRQPCQSNTNCIDAESECRKGQCWCKPGLSHNPVNNSCVALCPGRYGETFQILEGFSLTWNNRYSILNNGGNINDACIHECLNTNVLDYVCKYIDVMPITNVCNFNEIPVDEVPQLTPYDGELFLQRDCALSL